MGRFKPYNYAQGVLISVSLDDQLMPGTLEFAINRLVEKHIDMSIFDGKYKNDETGRPAYDPKILLKVVLLGYSRGFISSRKIEQSCKENIVFMALSCGQYPDYTTIATFVSTMKDEILPLFRNILLVCEEMDLLGGTFFAQDGCKLPSNASKQWSGKVSDLKKKKDRIEEKVRKMLKEQEEEDRKDDDLPSPSVSSREKQIEKLTKQAERIDAWLKENDGKTGKKGKEIKSNITDNESSLMTTSHGSIQGYNGQAVVDSKHQVIVHGEVFGTGQDADLVPPMIDGTKKNMEKNGHEDSDEYFQGKIFTADSAYHSKDNLQKCVDEKLDAYIPDKWKRMRDPGYGERRKQGKTTRAYFAREDYLYNENEDQYICPNGKILRLQTKHMVSTGNVYRRYRAQEEDCRGCGLREKCIYKKALGPKCLMIPIGPDGVNLTKVMIEKIESEEGRKIYPQRMAIVEPVFGNIRSNKRLDRFTLWGKIKVNIQWLLYCMIHNIEKIMNYGYGFA
jgi:transposase